MSKSYYHRISVVFIIILTFGSGASMAQSIPGLSADVEVLTPETLVPTFVAQNQLDLATAQGYIQARDRFFQMDFTRRLISGTLSELVGTTALSNDIQLRTLGLRRASWDTYQQSPPEIRALLQAYSNGVNAWLATNPLPPEYAGLELTEAEPWTPVDSIAVGKALAFQLSENLEDIDATVTLGTYQAGGRHRRI